jgi:prepilin-type N-terminal cleavage/methylation domain-containing protein
VGYHTSVKGFTLIEVIVSLFIVAVTVVLTGAMLQATALTKHVRNEDLGSKIASNELETLRSLGYAAIPTSGTFSDARLSSLPSGVGTFDVSAYDVKTKKVIVTVSWRESNQATSTVALTTLVTQLGGLP